MAAKRMQQQCGKEGPWIEEGLGAGRRARALRPADPVSDSEKCGPEEFAEHRYYLRTIYLHAFIAATELDDRRVVVL